MKKIIIAAAVLTSVSLSAHADISCSKSIPKVLKQHIANISSKATDIESKLASKLFSDDKDSVGINSISCRDSNKSKNEDGKRVKLKTLRNDGLECEYKYEVSESGEVTGGMADCD